MQTILKFIKDNRKFAILMLFFGVFYLAIFVIFRYNQITQADIQKFVEPYGWWGLLILLAVQIVFSLTPMPDGAMPLISYMLYGPVGVIVITLGMYIAGIIHYSIGKKLGKAYIVRHFPQITHFLGMLKDGNTILKLVYVRMFSIITFDVASYLAGISNIDFKTFTISFFIGIFHNNFTIMLVSSGLFASTAQDQLTVWLLVVASITLLAYLYKRSRMKLS